MNEVWVTGIGPVSAIGVGRAAFVQGLADGHGAMGSCSLFAAETPVAEVRDFDLGSILSSSKTYLDRASEFVLAAAQLALTDAGLAPGAYDRWRAGVVLGSEYGCLGTLHTFTAGVQQKGARLANSILFSHSYVNTPTSLVSIEFGLGGHHGTFAGAAAGQQALDGAVESLQLGRADLLLVIGVDVLTEPLYRALLAEGDLDAATALGEGACALVVETAAHATARGVTGMPLQGGDGAAMRPLLGRTGAAEPFFAVAAEMLRPAAPSR